MFVSGKGSISQMIQHSAELRRVFCEFVKETVLFSNASTIDNLRAAKHRFESLQKPMGRACLHIEALIKTALHTMSLRDDKQAKRSAQFLLFLDDEKLLSLAMLADAADESLLLTRVLDNEDVDPAVANEEVMDYVGRIEGLFGNEKRCLTATGYTSMMLAQLSKPIVFTIKGETRSVGRHGGVLPATIESCSARMRCWNVLARATLAAEFPDFEFLTSLSVFNIKSGNCRGEAEGHLNRIACSLDLDAAKLIAQFNDIWPRIQHVAATEQLTNRDACQTVLGRIKDRQVVAQNHPTDTLGEALEAFVAYGASTSGVEQSFSKGSWLFGNRQLKAHEDVEESIIKLGLDLPNNDLPYVVAIARRVWAHCFGMPRQQKRCSRIDAGVRRPGPSSSSNAMPGSEMDGATRYESEIDFLRARRQAGREAARGVAVGNINVPELESVMGMEGWTDNHSKELGFINTKLHKRKVQAAAERTLLPSERTTGLHEEAREAKRVCIRDQRARERKAARAEASHSKTVAQVFEDIKGMTVFIEHDVVNSALKIEAGCCSLRVKSCHADADVLVVADVASMGQEAQWAAAIRGCYVMSPSTLLEKRGGIVKAKRAAAIQRTIFVSEACRKKHSRLLRFIGGVVQQTHGGVHRTSRQHSKHKSR